MTSKQTPSARQVAARERKKEIRKGLAVLKRKGLYSGDAKRAKGNSYQASLIRTFADVISGQGTAVKVPKKDQASLKREGVRIKNGRAAIHGAPKEQVRYNSKSKSFIGRRKYAGDVIYRDVFFQHTLDVRKFPKPPKGVEYQYRTSFTSPKTGKVSPTAWWGSAQELEAFLNQYQGAQSKNSRTRLAFRELWTNAVEIREVKYRHEEDDGIEHGWERD